MTNIYHLENNGVPFYVGKTINPHLRWTDHKRTYGDCNLVVVHICSDKNADKIERRTITNYLNMGFELENRMLYEKKDKGCKYNYDFKSYETKRAFQQLALDTDTTLQELITEALETKYPKIK